MRVLGSALRSLRRRSHGSSLQEAHAGVEGRAAPGFQRPEADAVELGADRQHVFGAHAGGDQRLVSVAQDQIGDENFSHAVCLALQFDNRNQSPTCAAIAAAMAAASNSAGGDLTE